MDSASVFANIIYTTHVVGPFDGRGLFPRIATHCPRGLQHLQMILIGTDETLAPLCWVVGGGRIGLQQPSIDVFQTNAMETMKHVDPQLKLIGGEFTRSEVITNVVHRFETLDITRVTSNCNCTGKTVAT